MIDGNVRNVAELALASKVVFLTAQREKSGYEVDQGWFDWKAGQRIEGGCVEPAMGLNEN